MLHAQLKGERHGDVLRAHSKWGLSATQSSFQAPYLLMRAQEVCDRRENEALIYKQLWPCCFQAGVLSRP